MRHRVLFRGVVRFRDFVVMPAPAAVPPGSACHDRIPWCFRVIVFMTPPSPAPILRPAPPNARIDFASRNQ
ncbi:hypothetical protein QDK53_15090 [Amycolatopsis magusensis]|nr:hypothetical protein [Amycolatopsis magusensis]